MELAHYVTPVRRQEWSEVADQRLYVWARFVDDRTRTIAGAEFLHPYVSLDTNHKVIDHQELEHPEIWFADQTDTDEDLRGHGIASALYAHLRAFHYAITPSPALMAGGCALWQRLHPTYDADEEAGLLQTRSVVFTEAKLSEIITRFAPDPNGEIFDLRTPIDRNNFGFKSWPAGTSDV